MLGLFLAVLAAMVLVYAGIFHAIMAMEGRQFSWFSGLYWTLTVMSTLGFGDITFESDLGRAFSMLVLVSGTVFLLVLFPFIVIQFFWAPWMEAQAAALPVAAMATAGVPAVVADGVTGLLAPQGDAKALGDALTRLLGDAALRKTMGTAARNHILRERSVARATETLNAAIWPLV